RRRSRSTSGSSYLRPMKRLIEKMVFSEFVIACRFATSPTRRSPLLVKATIEGVVRLPSALGMTTGSPPSITATQLFVVPRSMPITFATVQASLNAYPCSSQCNPDHPIADFFANLWAGSPCRAIHFGLVCLDCATRDLHQRRAQEQVAERIAALD